MEPITVLAVRLANVQTPDGKPTAIRGYAEVQINTDFGSLKIADITIREEAIRTKDQHGEWIAGKDTKMRIRLPGRWTESKDGNTFRPAVMLDEKLYGSVEGLILLKYTEQVKAGDKGGTGWRA